LLVSLNSLNNLFPRGTLQLALGHLDSLKFRRSSWKRSKNYSKIINFELLVAY